MAGRAGRSARLNAMQVALIVPAPFARVFGYTYDRRIVAGLRAAGHQVDVIELAGAHPVTDETARNAACAAWDALPEASRIVIDGLAVPAFAGMEDTLAARGAVALIHHPTARETGFSEEVHERLRAIEQRLLPRFARVIVTSESTRAQLASEFGVAPERITVVMPGTDDVPRSRGSGGPTCRILSIGALVPRKGHDELLRALARLFDLDWHLTIVGSPTRNPAHAHGLAALAEELGIARQVEFAGELADAALEVLWQRTDLFALASHWEGYGMAMAEALKRGVPVAVTAVGIAPTLVTPEVGVLVQPGDRDTLSKSLRRLIFSAELRHDMAEAAWQVGQRLPSWHDQSRAFAAALLSKG
jgi:glycosyltransferase involved in cell wall biosynthesis